MNTKQAESLGIVYIYISNFKEKIMGKYKIKDSNKSLKF